MSRIKRKFLDFKFPIGAVIVGSLFLILGIASMAFFSKFIIGIILIPIGAYLAFSYTGLLIKNDSGMFKYYQSHFGIIEGDWKFLKYYPYLSILTINKKQNTYGPNQIQILDRFKVFRLYLLNENHTEKFLLGEYRNLGVAEKKAESFANELKNKIVTYSPTISAESMAKKR